MPVRATKRGAERTPLGARDCDVLICGASFAGLALARELAGSGMRVLIVDRYEIGERQTSACAMPTLWLSALDLMGSLRQTFSSLLVHTRPRGAARARTSRWPMPWTFSTFDYRELCALLFAQADLAQTEFETATVSGRTGGASGGSAVRGASADRTVGAGHAASANPDHAASADRLTSADVTVHTDRGDLRAPFVIDALGWRRVLSSQGPDGHPPIQPPNARLSRGLEVHPAGAGDELELWIDHRYVRSGYAWSFPARDEVRIGAGSFWPAHHVREPTVRLAGELGYEPDGYQGNWIPHQLRPAVEDGVFFAGDSAGHCLPLTAEGIRTAIYFGLACARELRLAYTACGGDLSGPDFARARARALARYGAFSDSHARKYAWLLRVQRAIGQLTPTHAPSAVARAMTSRRFGHWAWWHYLDIAPPAFAQDGPRGSGVRLVSQAGDETFRPAPRAAGFLAG